MQKIKIISNTSQSKIEKEVNEWIANNNKIVKIIDIKFSTYMAGFQTAYDVMIIFE